MAEREDSDGWREAGSGGNFQIVEDVRRALAARDADNLRKALEACAGDPRSRLEAQQCLADVLIGTSSPEEKNEIFALLDSGMMAALVTGAGISGPLNMALLSVPDSAAVEKLLLEASNLKPGHAGLAIQYVRLLAMGSSPERVREFIEQRQRVFAEPANLVFLDVAFLTPEERQRTADFIATLTPDDPMPLRKQAIKWLLGQGRWKEGQERAESLRTGRLGGGIGRIIGAIETAPQTNAMPQPYGGLEDVLYRPGDPERGIALIFGGLGDTSLLAPIVIDRYLASLGVGSLLLRDDDRLVFLNGVRSLGSNMAATVDRLREIVASTGAQKIYTLGSSGGCFGAILYGYQLRADACVCFSPPTLAANSVRDHDPRIRIVLRRLNRLFGDEERDIVYWRERTGYDMPLTIHYCEDNDVDRFHAERVAGMPGVDLRPIASATHGSMLELARRGNFASLLAEELGLSENPES